MNIHARVLRGSIGLVLLMCVATRCSLGLAQAPEFVQENKAENLKKFCETIHAAIYKQQDTKRAADMFQSLALDEARLKKALKDDVNPDLLKKLAEEHKKMVFREADAPRLAKSNQTEIQVHGATTEEMIAYREDSVAYKEFPGGAKQVAAELLRPGMTFYEVEFLEPGDDKGMKYHLFFWDGKQWSMLGPAWRMVR